MAFDISQQVKVVNPMANVDYYYGTYASIADACVSVPYEIRKIGKTVGIETDNGVVEYWWKNGIGDEDLIIKGGQGPKGEDGKDGADGVSVTHSWNGTTLTITSASGTSSANLKGERGEQGEKGEQGDKGDRGEQGIQGEKGDTAMVNLSIIDNKLVITNVNLSQNNADDRRY